MGAWCLQNGSVYKLQYYLFTRKSVNWVKKFSFYIFSNSTECRVCLKLGKRKETRYIYVACSCHVPFSQRIYFTQCHTKRKYY